MYGNVNSNDGYGVSQILLFAPVNRPWTDDDVISRGTQPIMCSTDWDRRLVEKWYNDSCRRGKIWEIGGNLAIPHTYTYIHQLYTYEKKSNDRAKNVGGDWLFTFTFPQLLFHPLIFLIFPSSLFLSRAKFVPDFQPTDEANAAPLPLPVPPDGKYSPPSPEEAERIISNLLPR